MPNSWKVTGFYFTHGLNGVCKPFDTILVLNEDRADFAKVVAKKILPIVLGTDSKHPNFAGVREIINLSMVKNDVSKHKVDSTILEIESLIIQCINPKSFCLPGSGQIGNLRSFSEMKKILSDSLNRKKIAQTQKKERELKMLATTTGINVDTLQLAEKMRETGALEILEKIGTTPGAKEKLFQLLSEKDRAELRQKNV